MLHPRYSWSVLNAASPLIFYYHLYPLLWYYFEFLLPRSNPILFCFMLIHLVVSGNFILQQKSTTKQCIPRIIAHSQFVVCETWRSIKLVTQTETSQPKASLSSGLILLHVPCTLIFCSCWLLLYSINVKKIKLAENV